MNRISLGDSARCDRATRNWRDQQVPEDDEDDYPEDPYGFHFKGYEEEN
jgi:hypothetical protein